MYHGSHTDNLPRDEKGKFRWRDVVLSVIVLGCLIGCHGCTGGGDGGSTGGDTPEAGSSDSAADGFAPPKTAADHNLDIPMVEYKWDPQAGDPSVPAELGGPGFTGEGWQTNMKFPALGSAKAVKGGSLSQSMPDWPATLRMAGKDWNTEVNYFINDTCYEQLVGIHPTTLEYLPELATHWQISEDRMTYRFRINPKARFSDGSEVTTADVIATFKLHMDETLLSPSSILVYSKLHEPVALSKYILEVKVKSNNWRNFVYFGAGLSIFPAKEASIKGSEYLDKYQFSYTANTGPYSVKPEGIDRGKSVSITRRHDWWDKDNPAWAGMWNIDTFKWVVVKSRDLAFEKIKKGEIDYFFVLKLQLWDEEILKLDSVSRGLLIPRKFYTDAPHGVRGLAINMNRAPLDDRRVRLALSHLLDRETVCKKIYGGHTQPFASYYPGGQYANPANKQVEYDEFRAVELLEEAGWTQKGPDGIRTKSGQRLSLSITYGLKMHERFLTVYKEACGRAGVEVNLEFLTPASRWKNLQQKKYDMSYTGWGALVFPNPETSYHSKLAGKLNNNNITSFANKRVDEICDEYDVSYDQTERVELIRELDGLVYNDHPYVLSWYTPAIYTLYWNKYSMPEWASLRIGERDNLPYCWWVDPDKKAKLQKARGDSSVRMPRETAEVRFWKHWGEAQSKKKTASAPTAAGSEG